MRSVAFALALISGPSVALAHFRLEEPVASLSQTAVNGDPQKMPPCGQDGTASVVDTVTNYSPGGMLTLKLKETIDHPGHYRVAIAQDVASLPPPPTITKGICEAAAINPAPAPPILADGLFVNLTKADGIQTVQIPIPAGYECKNCVIQVIEYMSSLSTDPKTSCFYYHCANVNIVANAPDAGMVTPTPDAATGEGSGSNNAGGGEISGGCSTGNATGLLAIVGLLGLRRRRRN